MEHHDYVKPRIQSSDISLYKEFIKENRIIEDDWQFRKGAAFTAGFGLEDGWGPNMEPGYIRIHLGVDRANGGSITVGGKTIKDVVICPFNFDSTGFIDYKGINYGSLVFLTSKKYQFEIRIAHMNPKTDIIPWSLEQFKKGAMFKQGWVIGKAGNYGYSTGAHTHTELVSLDESSEVLEIILEEKYGEKLFKEYSEDFIINEYRKREFYKDWKNDSILKHWIELKKKKAVIFINEFKCCFVWKNKVYTRYASNKVFNGL